MSAVATWSLDDHGEQPVARLGERGEGLERFEGHRQAAAVALVLVALAGGVALAEGALSGRLRGAAGAIRSRLRRLRLAWLGFLVLVFGFEAVAGIRLHPLLGIADHPGRCVRLGSYRHPGAKVESEICDQSARQRRVDAPQRLLAAEQRDALEDARRDGRAGDRHAQRLVDLARLRRAMLDDRFERRLDRRLVEARQLGERRADVARAPRARPRPASARAPSDRRPGRRRGTRQRPEVGERVDLLLADRAAPRARPSRPVNASRRCVSSSTGSARM